jgi:hypothetical protein
LPAIFVLFPGSEFELNLPPRDDEQNEIAEDAEDDPAGT